MIKNIFITYVIIIMLMKNISTEFFDVELLLYYDNNTYESYKDYFERNVKIGIENYLVNFKSGDTCTSISEPDCYQINSNGKLIMEEKEAVNNNLVISKMVYQNRKQILSKLKSIDLYEQGINMDDRDYKRQSVFIRQFYYKYKLYPYPQESIKLYWDRIDGLLISCVNSNTNLIGKNERITFINSVSKHLIFYPNTEYDWFIYLKLDKPTKNEAMFSYYMRMVKCGKVPLNNDLLKKFYFLSWNLRNNNMTISNPAIYFKDEIEDNLLQIIYLCNRPKSDEGSSSQQQSFDGDNIFINTLDTFSNEQLDLEEMSYIMSTLHGDDPDDNNNNQ